MKIGIIPQDIAINCTYDDITNGTSVGTWTNIIDAKKIKEVSEAGRIIVNEVEVEANYVEIKDGQIYLTEEGAAANLQNYVVTVSADGVDAEITINTIPTYDAQVNSEATVNVGMLKNVTAAYLDGTTAAVKYNKLLLATNAKITTGEAGVIVVYVNGEAFCMLNVK